MYLWIMDFSYTLLVKILWMLIINGALLWISIKNVNYELCIIAMLVANYKR